MTVTRVVVDYEMADHLVALGNPDCDLCGHLLSTHRWYKVQPVGDTDDNAVVDCSKPTIQPATTKD